MHIRFHMIRKFAFIIKCLKALIKFNNTTFWVLSIIKMEHFIKTISVFWTEKKTKEKKFILKIPSSVRTD